MKQELLQKQETIESLKSELTKLQQNLTSQQNNYDTKLKQYEDKFNVISQKDQMKANVLSSFNKKMSQIKNNPPPETNNSSYNEAINSSSSNGNKSDLNNPEMTPHISNSLKLSYNLQTLIRNLNFLHEEKEKVKNSIKDWNEDFEKTQQRKATNEEKKQISSFYAQYNNYNQQIKVLEEKLENTKNLKAQINLTKLGNESNNKSKSVSPRKAHLAKIMQMNKNLTNSNNANYMSNVLVDNNNQNSNLSNLINNSVNQSFDISTLQKNNEKNLIKSGKKIINETQNNSVLLNSSVNHSFENGKTKKIIY